MSLVKWILIGRTVCIQLDWCALTQKDEARWWKQSLSFPSRCQRFGVFFKFLSSPLSQGSRTIPMFFKLSGQFYEVKHRRKCQTVLSECELKGVKTLMVNGECSFEASPQLDNMSSPALTGTIGFSAWDPDTAHQWQADNSANFSRLGLWMALYDRLVECDWWPRLNNGTLPPPYRSAQKHWNPSWHTELLPIVRQCKRNPSGAITCTWNKI